MRSERIEGAAVESTVSKNGVTKIKQQKQRGRRRWFSVLRGKKEERKVNIIVDDQYDYINAFSKDLPETSYSLVSSSNETNSKGDKATHNYHCNSHYDKNELLIAESQMQKYVKELTEPNSETQFPASILNRSPSPSNVEHSQNLKLVTSTGVLLFDGIDEHISDDESLQNMIDEEQKFRNKGSVGKSSKTNFVVAPKHYDPIVSGFYKPKCGENKTFYESDEEDYNMTVHRQPKVSVGIEIVLRDGSLSILT